MTKQRTARVCRRIQLPAISACAGSVIVGVVAGLCRQRWVAVGAGMACAVLLVIFLVASVIELSLVYASFDRVNRTWTTAWGETFREHHMPGKVGQQRSP